MQVLASTSEISISFYKERYQWISVAVYLYHSNSSDDKLVIFFLFSLENRIWHFMQIVSNWDSLHEISNPVSWEK